MAGVSSGSVEDADQSILTLFPSLNFRNGSATSKRAFERNLLVLLAVGEGKVTRRQIVKSYQFSNLAVAKSVGVLEAKGLLCKKAMQTSKSGYYLTAKGVVALMAFPEFRNFEQTRSILTKVEYRDDSLAFALLTIGSSLGQRSEAVYELLLEYAKAGHNIEDIDSQTAALSLLEFLSNKWRHERQTVPEYLSVFREFTTQGFELLMRTILASIRPRPDDLNCFVQFLCEVADFYHNPIRRSYLSILKDNPHLRKRLEEFKDEQESLVKREGASAEVTLRVRNMAEFYRFSHMPAHLQAIGVRLIVEPLDFMVR
ncbi:MAG: hypothetical protein QXJ75_03960, partial [Candidatus Bathyarchaeia archaeon]